MVAETVTVRPAVEADAEAIAPRHSDSWRRHYRGAFSDAYLDGDVFDDRLTVWTERLTNRRPDTQTSVTEFGGVVVGLAHAVFDHDPTWGALLDNLHVVHTLKRQGIGTRLMRDTARSMVQRTPSTPLPLWVLGQNTAGRAFYDARGGVGVERQSRSSAPSPGSDSATSGSTPPEGWGLPARRMVIRACPRRVVEVRV